MIKSLSFGVVLVVCALIALITLGNMSNINVPAGYAGYVFTKPLVGKGKFSEVIIGPTSTGFRWRIDCQLVSVTPYTYHEDYPADDPILASDKLPLKAASSIVWEIRPDTTAVRAFMEQYGGLNGHTDPDDIARQAYANYTAAPFRMVTREIMSAYPGLDINSNLPKISEDIFADLKKRLAATPFDVISVTVGKATPPDPVISAIAVKVATQQALETKHTEFLIAEQDVQIQKTKGEAEGSKAAAKATQDALAIATLTRAITPPYLQYLAIQNLQGADRVYLPTTNGIPTVGTIPLGPPPAAHSTP